MIKRIILADPAIKKIGGHYYEYAKSIEAALKEQGVELVVIGNKRLSKDLEASNVFPCFDYEFWDGFRPVPSGFMHTLTEFLLTKGLKYATRRFYSSKSFTNEFKSRRSLGYAYGKLAYRAPLRLLQILEERFGIEGTAVKSTREARVRIAQERYRKSMQKELVPLLKRLNFGSGDLLFLPTSSENELIACRSLLNSSSAFKSAKLAFLFRRPMFFRYPGQDVDAAWDYQNKGELVQNLKEVSSYPNMYFFTDTEQLTQHYNSINGAKFHTLPIPHTRAQDITKTGIPKLPDRFHVTYVGDARTEKGYHFIPDIAEKSIERRLTKPAPYFSLQSNFNIDAGEPEVVIAKARLKAMPSEHIRLFDSALSSELYWSLLASGDVTLLLYDHDLYRERSSGIVTESLSVGVPVIAPSGSWLSDQFEAPTRLHREQLAASCRPVVSFGFAPYEFEDLLQAVQSGLIKTLHRVKRRSLILRRLLVEGLTQAYEDTIARNAMLNIGRDITHQKLQENAFATVDEAILSSRMGTDYKHPSLPRTQEGKIDFDALIVGHIDFENIDLNGLPVDRICPGIVEDEIDLLGSEFQFRGLGIDWRTLGLPGSNFAKILDALVVKCIDHDGPSILEKRRLKCLGDKNERLYLAWEKRSKEFDIEALCRYTHAYLFEHSGLTVPSNTFVTTTIDISKYTEKKNLHFGSLTFNLCDFGLRGDEILEVIVEQFDLRGVLVGTLKTRLSCPIAGRLRSDQTIIWRHATEATTLKVVFFSAYNRSLMRLSNLKLNLLEDAELRGDRPLSSVGLTFGSIEEVPFLLSEISAYKDWYRTTATVYGNEYIKFHSAANYVSELLKVVDDQ